MNISSAKADKKGFLLCALFSLAVCDTAQNVTVPFTKAFHLVFLRHTGMSYESEKIFLLLSKAMNDKNMSTNTDIESYSHLKPL